MGSYPLAGLAPVRIFYCCYSLVLNGVDPNATGIMMVLVLGSGSGSGSGSVFDFRLLVRHTDLLCCMFLFVPALAFLNFQRGTADATLNATMGLDVVDSLLHIMPKKNETKSTQLCQNQNQNATTSQTYSDNMVNASWHCMDLLQLVHITINKFHGE